MADLVEGQGKRGPKPRGFVLRFWESVIVKGPDECWPWIGQIMKDTGYGRLSIANKPHSAHRLSFLIHHGVIDPDLLVMHSCDNRVCVNPAHLSQGTDADNITDAVVKGRLQKGERNGMAKLTESEVLEIRRAFMDGDKTMAELAALHNVWVPCIWRIIKGTRWKHLLNPV